MKNRDGISIQVACGCTDTDGLWLCHSALPLLMFYSNSKNAITDSVTIPYAHNKCVKNPYTGCILSNGLLILSPYNAKEIVLYDPNKNNFIAMKLRGISKEYQQVFLGNFIHENECIFFPCKYKFLVKLNIQKKLLLYLNIPGDFIYNDDLITKFVVINDFVVATLCMERAFLIYHIASNRWEKKKIVGKGKGFSRFIFVDHKYIVLNYSEGIVECFDQYTFEKECELNVEDIFGYSIESDGVNIIRMDGNHIMINVIATGECIVCDSSLNIIRDMSESKIRLNRGYAFPIEDANHRVCIFEKYRRGIVNENLTIDFEELIDSTNVGIKAIDYCASNGIVINEMNGLSLDDFLIGINDFSDQLPKTAFVPLGTSIYRSMLGDIQS